MKKYLISLSFLLFGVFASATNYYVKNSGSDANTGLSDAQAWQTIAKVNAQAFAPGDSIFFNRGDTWREELDVSSSGTSSNYIIFGAYGSGAKPKLYGSDVSASWTNTSGNVWESTATLSTPRPAEIFFEETDGSFTWGTFKTYVDLSELTQEYDWTWNANKVYVYAATDPDVRYTEIEIPQRNVVIDTYHKEYIEFQYLDIRYGMQRGIDDNSFHTDHIAVSGLICDSLHVGPIGGLVGTQVGYGIATPYSDLIIRNCEIHDCGRRGVSLDIYGFGFTATNALIENCTFYNGTHTTAMDVSVGSGSYTGSWNGITFRNNLVYEDPAYPLTYYSNMIFLQTYTGGTLQGVSIYNNIFKYHHGTCIQAEQIQGANIYNNTFYEVNPNVTSGYYYQVYINTTCTNIFIKNNIFYSTLNLDTNGAGLGLATYNTSLAEIDADYNLYYRINNSVRVALLNGTSYYMNSTPPFGTEETNCTQADPTFVSSSDYHLQAGSPAIAAGINVGLSTDRDAVSWNDPPSVGVYEYNAVSQVVRFIFNSGKPVFINGKIIFIKK